jgi:cleavage and polyadenylation specificity factor subunit 3
MTRFKSKLLSLNSKREKPIKVFSPPNCEMIEIPFKRDKFAKVVGRLAQLPPQNGGTDRPDDDRIVSGVLVQNGFNLTLMAAEDLKEFAGLTTTTINLKRRLFCSAGVDLIKWGLEGMFGGIEDMSSPKSLNGKSNGTATDDHNNINGETTTTFLVMDCVTVDIASNGEVSLEWEGNMMNDAIADSVLSVLLQMETGMVGVKRMTPSPLSLSLSHSLSLSLSHTHTHSITPCHRNLLTSLSLSLSGSRSSSPHPHSLTPHNPHASTRDSSQKLARLLLLLENQFGDSITPVMGEDGKLDKGGFAPGLEISVPPFTAKVWLRDLSIECKNPPLKARVQAVVEKAAETIAGMGVE